MGLLGGRARDGEPNATLDYDVALTSRIRAHLVTSVVAWSVRAVAPADKQPRTSRPAAGHDDLPPADLWELAGDLAEQCPGPAAAALERGLLPAAARGMARAAEERDESAARGAARLLYHAAPRARAPFEDAALAAVAAVPALRSRCALAQADLCRAAEAALAAAAACLGPWVPSRVAFVAASSPAALWSLGRAAYGPDISISGETNAWIPRTLARTADGARCTPSLRCSTSLASVSLAGLTISGFHPTQTLPGHLHDACSRGASLRASPGPHSPPLAPRCCGRDRLRPTAPQGVAERRRSAPVGLTVSAQPAAARQGHARVR